MREIIKFDPEFAGFIEPRLFSFSVENNKIKDVDMEVGYAHRGIEKLMMERPYKNDLLLAERVCGICSNSHSSCFAMALEKLTETEISNRAKYIRIIMLEMERLHSHLLYFVLICKALDEFDLLIKLVAVRERLMSLIKSISGNRVNYSINTFGGVKRDISTEVTPDILDNLDEINILSEKLVTELDPKNSIGNKTFGIGNLTTEMAGKLGTVGPNLRASGIDEDLRRDAKYLSYEDFEFDVIVLNIGDVRARALTRALEIIQTVRIIENALENLPEGELRVQPGNLKTGEVISRIEAPRGELAYFVKSDGSNIPHTIKIRTPTFANYLSLKHMLIGQEVDYAHLIIESIDPCISCTDR